MTWLVASIIRVGSELRNARRTWIAVLIHVPCDAPSCCGSTLAPKLSDVMDGLVFLAEPKLDYPVADLGSEGRTLSTGWIERMDASPASPHASRDARSAATGSTNCWMVCRRTLTHPMPSLRGQLMTGH